ncbi:FKBP-type peptidyl-prolyl cis-trans isomerase [Dysgonomonas macrotermitis]|uniref:Peptidyl-prolyl cis-trans isomerase n=1 Tax=Dysgonomonas macrotermitis TaxID=1346286 RepID=A0A1M4SYA3_9BACT|nr:FKBP-type peptidyl-prolyl cis-trans isomerase [Dysgonomonas macrotermitis]SHE36987.1 FKBP-type peptidyl-prolyl cis-trans isomerase [Dysgonomonas macrotermitis]
MKKKTYSIFFVLFAFSLFFATSCLNNDDDEVEIDEEWKALNDTRFNQAAADASLTGLESQTGGGKVYWKKSTVITDSDNPSASIRVTVTGKPEFTDTVGVRYEGWYFNKDGDKVIFDSTENESLTSTINGTGNPNKETRYLAVNPATTSSSSNNYIGGMIEGWSTLIQDMVTGEERDVCIPYVLAYGGTARTSSNYVVIPAYTTLWFRIKLIKIYPMKGLS